MGDYRRLNMHWYKFQSASRCKDCGAIVIQDDILLHDAWHESLKKIAADLYGVSPEDM